VPRDSDLRDFRGKITPETWCWLEAVHRATGDEHSAIVRDVLHRWAGENLRAATIAGRLLSAEGIARNTGEADGG